MGLPWRKGWRFAWGLWAQRQKGGKDSTRRPAVRLMSGGLAGSKERPSVCAFVCLYSTGVSLLGAEVGRGGRAGLSL